MEYTMKVSDAFTRAKDVNPEIMTDIQEKLYSGALTQEGTVKAIEEAITKNLEEMKKLKSKMAFENEMDRAGMEKKYEEEMAKYNQKNKDSAFNDALGDEAIKGLGNENPKPAKPSRSDKPDTKESMADVPDEL